MTIKHKRVTAVFYRTAQGNEVVLDWLRSLEPDDRRAIGFDLKDVEFGWPVGMPLSVRWVTACGKPVLT